MFLYLLPARRFLLLFRGLFRVEAFSFPGDFVNFTRFSKIVNSITMDWTEIKDEMLDKLIFPFNKFNLTALEYKPFTRFTIAKSLDDLTSNKLSKLINYILRDRKTGCFIIGPKNINPKIDDNFLVKLSTAVAHLIGIPHHDSMYGKYYARFHIKHEDDSDSYLRKAYINMDLHTDGTYVKEKTDWLLMTKIEEKNVE